jgi:uncharacterized RDD family membrane protein YckC
MSIVKLDTGFNIEVEFPVSPFHKRAIAWCLDILIQLIYMWMGQKIIVTFIDPHWVSSLGWLTVLLVLPVLLYEVVLESTLQGQTIGKKIMGIKVISADGGQPSVSQFIIRWLFRMIDFPLWIIGAVTAGDWPWWASIFIFSGVIAVFATEKTQRVGDLLAGTIIIDTKNKTSWEDTIFMDVAEDHKPTFPEVMKLTDRDINSIKQVFESAKKDRNNEYASRVAEKIKTALQIQTDMEPFDFIELLLKDYNHLSIK